jgi:uncharacterized protein with GYD domain
MGPESMGAEMDELTGSGRSWSLFGKKMALFLLQASFTPQAWATFTRNPQDREEVLRNWCERAGAKAQALYFAFGAEHEVYAIFDAPSQEIAAAFAVAVNSAGHLKSCKTTRLLNSQEAVEIMKIAGGLGFQPPNP